MQRVRLDCRHRASFEYEVCCWSIFEICEANTSREGKQFIWCVIYVHCFSAVNVKAVAELESKAKDAEENQGESEILDAALETAEHYYRIGDQVGYPPPIFWRE